MRRKNTNNMVVQDSQTGQCYVATDHKNWPSRLATWKRAYLLDNKTTVPAPSPVGHIMFKNAGTKPSRFVVISWEDL